MFVCACVRVCIRMETFEIISYLNRVLYFFEYVRSLCFRVKRNPIFWCVFSYWCFLFYSLCFYMLQYTMFKGIFICIWICAAHVHLYVCVCEKLQHFHEFCATAFSSCTFHCVLPSGILSRSALESWYMSNFRVLVL